MKSDGKLPSAFEAGEIDNPDFALGSDERGGGEGAEQREEPVQGGGQGVELSAPDDGLSGG